MASGSYWQAYVLCPFYLYDDGKRCIHCEGITDGSTVRLSFRSRTDYEKYIRHNCCRHYQACQIYRAVESTYEGVFEHEN